ncbi:transcriptional regulator [Herbaspirillum sp. BH-1]|uniref:HTH-type transcriptional regulator/antitoxin HigA n=2 Tax=Herbaspirillum TaxID=963 RepID=A0ABU1PGA2_9BURK|nr:MULTISPECIES: helix-turn-helix domain-containing protein [Herbaspirillum]MDR6584755.1 HTH-type transcriptional regulator/antitoxin HigA [Herbaspirillum frisingense]ONN66645.1 transcriptional regulator [Herbaspirillum sp. VT-16-41]PLY58547.1 transcriptional regulator [Herbaspirillum sp. BH-1]
MEKSAMDKITSHFAALSSLIPLRPIRSDDDYDRAVTTLNQLLDAGAGNEKHPLADLVDTLGSLIAEYDDKHFPLQQVSPVDVLQFLMEQHQLTQSDLPEIGSQGVVSEILRGKRELNLRQVKALAQRFGVGASVFIG